MKLSFILEDQLKFYTIKEDEFSSHIDSLRFAFFNIQNLSIKFFNSSSLYSLAIFNNF